MSTSESVPNTPQSQRIEKARHLAEGFAAVLENSPAVIPETGCLAGAAHPKWQETQEKVSYNVWEWRSDNLHFAMNTETLLRLGVTGIATEALQNADRVTGQEEAAYLRAIARCHQAAARFIGRHGEEAQGQADRTSGEIRGRYQRMANSCRVLAHGAPATFYDAVQLVWFARCLRRHGTIGRLDQHLYPFYQRDVAAGRLTQDGALSVLKDLWVCFNRVVATADSLQNMMLGGVDREGRDATNEVSGLMIDATLAIAQPEPYVNVRIHPATPSWFRDRVADLHCRGQGKGTVYNDEVIIPALVRAGVPLTSARNYANDGCTEVTIDGESGLAMAMGEVLKCLELALFNGEENLPGVPHGRYFSGASAERPLKTAVKTGYRTGDFAGMTSFEQIYQAFLKQFDRHIDTQLEALSAEIRSNRESGVSHPFMAGTFPVTLAWGKDLFRGGFTVPCQVVFPGSIPMVADALCALRKVVFEDQICTPAVMLAALHADFSGHEALRQRCLAAPKFGNDLDEVDLLAADIATHFCARIEAYVTPTGKPYWPTLFNHLFNDHAKLVGATPDGRHWKDPIGEHFSPGPGRARRGPTAVVRSVVKAPLARAFGSPIFNLSLARSLVPNGTDGSGLMRQFLASALQMGVGVMNLAVYELEQLKEARNHPERYPDLMVRVWGFSARFIDLSADMQDHILERVLHTPVPGSLPGEL